MMPSSVPIKIFFSGSSDDPELRKDDQFFETDRLLVAGDQLRAGHPRRGHPADHDS